MIIFNILAYILQIYTLILIIRALLTWFPQVDRNNPIVKFIFQITEPVLEPVRRVVPLYNGIDFSTSEAFGHVGWGFVALFGDMAPVVGKVVAPVGFSVVRVHPGNGEIQDFARNDRDVPGPASKVGKQGLERPISVRFDPSGSALYVVDFGVLRMTDEGPEPVPETGRLWRIRKVSP